MGKFYDAMQKVNQPAPSEARQPETAKPTLPELDDALLAPEGDDAANHTSTEVTAVPGPSRWQTVSASVDSEIASLMTRKPRQVAADSGEPVLRVLDPAEEADPDPIEHKDSFRSMRRLRTDVFRRPLEAAYERIIQRLFAYRRTPRESVILVTSSVSGEGTSTVARNVALALAQHRAERVLLIDANLRAPSQHTAFKLEPIDGLGDVLLGPSVLTAVIREVAPGLSLLASGRAKESPAQLLTVASLHGVIMALLSLYDWVIIDSPPATSYPDVATIAAACGGAILVVEAEKTRQEVVEEAKRVLNASGVDLLGAVLNRRRYHIPGFIYRRL